MYSPLMAVAQRSDRGLTRPSLFIPIISQLHKVSMFGLSIDCQLAPPMIRFKLQIKPPQANNVERGMTRDVESCAWKFLAVGRICVRIPSRKFFSFIIFFSNSIYFIKKILLQQESIVGDFSGFSSWPRLHESKNNKIHEMLIPDLCARSPQGHTLY